MRRTSTRGAANRIGTSFSRAVVTKTNPIPKLQQADVGIFETERASEVEVAYPYGWFARVHPPRQMDGETRHAETYLLAATGARSHPVALPPSDRRFIPPIRLQEGESAHYDDQKQVVHIARAGVTATGKKVTVTAGDKPDTKDFEHNEQMKGLRAEITQLRDSHHAMFDALSKLRENAEQAVPALAPLNLATQVTASLNGQASGLDAMKTRALGKLQGFFQNALKDALGSFLDPSRLLNATSLLPGGVEGLIEAAKAQIADLMAANPIIGIVDDLRADLAAVQASGGAPAAIAAKAAQLSGQIAGHVAANPVLAQVANIRATLQGHVDVAGPGLNFLEPLKRLAQGMTRSMRFGGPG